MPLLLKGEIGIEFDGDKTRLKVGDGTSTWSELPYIVNQDDIQLPAYFTWSLLSGVNTTSSLTKTDLLQLVRPAYRDKVDIKVINDNMTLIDNKFSEVDNRIAANTSSVANLVAQFSNGATAYDNAEVVDARTGYEGTIHNSLGDAVRAVGYNLQDLSKKLANFVDADAVDGLFYENNMLYLTAKGVIVSNGVEIKGGSGGGPSTTTYTVSFLNLLESRVLNVVEGKTALLRYNYSSTDEEGQDDGPGIATLSINNIRKLSYSIPQGPSELDITSYLSAGENTVRIQVENSEGSKKTLIYTVNVISLSLTTTFNALDLYQGVIAFPYTVSGQGEKTVYFILDGKQIGTEIVSSSGRSRVYSIAALPDGPHILRAYAEVATDSGIVKSNELQIGFLCYTSSTTSQLILINYAGGSVRQGDTLSIPYLIYDPFSENPTITLSIYKEDGSLYKSSTIMVDQTPKIWTTQDYPVGATRFQIQCGPTIEYITIDVAASSFDRTIIEDSKVFEFNAQGRTNAEENPGHWHYGDISASFEGFGWAGADGWLEDANGQTALRFLPNDKMSIPFMPFSSDFRQLGYTIEVELSTHNVQDYDTIAISSVSGGRGFVIKSQSAELRSEQSTVSIQFKEDTRVRITFVVEPRNLNRFVYIYINGVMCGAVQYPENDDFSQPSPVGVSIGAETCGLDLYVMRFYNKGLTRLEQLNNFICDRSTLAERLKADVRNNVLNDADEVDIAHLPLTIPYLVMECEELPQYKGDKKSGKSVVYVDPIHPERSYTADTVQFNVQGTSSQGYPVKNYKISFKNGIVYSSSGEAAKGWPIRVGALPAKTLCVKADFASSESANNTCLVEYYDDLCPYKDEPQKLDGRIQQGIRGNPIVIFWHNTETGKVSFLGRYNVNNDKSNENVFGFDRKTYPNCESVEFLNNTSHRTLFLESDYEKLDADGNPDWLNDFEYRFPDLDEPYQDYTQFKRLTDWIVSTARLSTDTEQQKTAKLAKFKNELSEYLILQPLLFYYLFTEVLLMIDSRAKNMFMTTFDGIHWFPIPYDFDTAAGTNNEGKLVFDYNLEDTDLVGGAQVFNGQTSALWCNVRDAYAAELQSMYAELRNGNIWSYENLKARMETHQATWPEAIWNEDMYIKYLQPFLLKRENYLEMLQGDKKAQRDWWLFNAFRYRDSKYQCGDAQKNFITLRCYKKGNITVTPYSHIWPRIKYGSATVTCRGVRNQSYVMECPLDTMNDTECYIYSADRLSSVGDLSHLNVGEAQFGYATKLQEIILGSDAEGYQNTMLNKLDVGNNELLTLLNIQNCVNLSVPIDVSGCHGLESVLANGSKITGITLPDGGHLHTLRLPNTLTNLTILNQKNITTLELAGEENLSTLRIENTPNIDLETIITNATNLNRVRLVGVEWMAANETSLMSNVRKLAACSGLSALGTNLDKAVLTGRVHVDAISDESLEEINTAFPELIVVVAGMPKFFIRYLDWDNTLLYRYIANEGSAAIDPVATSIISAPARAAEEDAKYTYVGWSSLPSNITKPYNLIAQYRSIYRIEFYAADNTTVLNTQWIENGQAAIEPVAANLITEPKKESTDQYTFTWTGWDKDFSNVSGPLKCMPTYSNHLRQYSVYFYNDSLRIAEIKVFYGDLAAYPGDITKIKKKINGQDSDYYEFIGWSPSLDVPISGPMYFYAQFAFDGYIEDSWETIANHAAAGEINIYGLGGRKKFTYTIDGVQSTVEAEIVDINHDILTYTDADYNGGKPTAAFTFVFRVLGAERWSFNSSPKGNGDQATLNMGGWTLSDLREQVNSVMRAALPVELQGVIKSVEKKSDGGFYDQTLKTTNDLLWVPSDRELNCENISYVVANQGEPYALFTDSMSRKKYDFKENTVIYWTRSTGTNGQHYGRYIDSQGNPGSMGAAGYAAINLGFCI